MTTTTTTTAPSPRRIHGKSMGVVSRAADLPGAYQQWKSIGDFQPHWGRKYEGDNPLVVTRNLREEGFAVAVPLLLGAGEEEVTSLYLATGTYRFLHRRDVDHLPPGTWGRLIQESWNGYYYRPVPEPWPVEGRPELVLWANWN